MYRYPPNSLEFKRGYRLGIMKGRVIERKICLAFVIGFVLVFELVHGLIFKICK